jgi:hypothetical protein
MFAYISCRQPPQSFSGTELHFFVIPAPGPYVCAEIACGGYPAWLVAKRTLRIRHLGNAPIGLVKKWDEQFHQYCLVYWRAIMAILVPHERTNKRNGCVIALQIENELHQIIAGCFGGIDSELRPLAEESRRAGSTVPFFHNDDWPAGSWATGEKNRKPSSFFRRTGEPSFRTDLYGFDLYFTFPPGDKSGDMSSSQVDMIEAGGISSCLNICGIGGAGVGGSDFKPISCLYKRDLRRAPPPTLAWVAAKQMQGAVDKLESLFRSIGGSASSGPPFVAETQVGWINQWGRLRGYDDIYNFFGPDFSATLLTSLAAQGITFTNHYMGYGGTNHGALGDTEVYTSYDYSAFIREFGMLSERGRRMRMSSLFLRSFATQGLAHTYLLSDVPSGRNSTKSRIKATVPSSLVTVRQAVTTAMPTETQPPLFAFLRNLSGGPGRFNLIVDDVVVPCLVASNEAMVAPLYYPLSSSVSVFACTIPIIARGSYAGAEVWILRVRKGEKGRIMLTMPNVTSSFASGSNKIFVQYAVLPSSSTITSLSPATGTLKASDQDQGAATSLFSAPLEELPLAEQWGSFSSTSPPVAVRASTESIGLCFSLALAGREDASVVAIRDSSSEAGPSPVLRLVCLSESDAHTLAADCSADDPFLANGTMNAIQSELSIDTPPFAAAWGAEELGFMPDSMLNIAYSERTTRSVFLIRHSAEAPLTSGASVSIPEQFSLASPDILNVMPGVYQYEVPAVALAADFSSSFASGMDTSTHDPLNRAAELPVDGWMRRGINWASDVDWKPIRYQDRDPLDHVMTSGHVAYRLRFRTKSKYVSIVTNVRHVAALWCNGVSVGSQVVYSHNVMSAGAMHAVDLPQAGKQRHELTRGLQMLPGSANGLHEVIILVLSLGQSRSPFLLNDVRNKRGLLSARLSRTARYSDIDWAIGGVDVRTIANASATCGLAIETQVNDRFNSTGFESIPSPGVSANDGVVFFRSTFKVPACTVVEGNVRYPLRLKVETSPRAVVVLWVNGLQIGLYIEALGPQQNFYVPEGLITDCKDNLIVILVYGPTDGGCSVRILPWVVDRKSGNIDEQDGDVFALREARLSLGNKKP